MKAVILAAGYGNRMRPLTDNTHKTLLKIGNNTVIGRIIDGLISNKILDFVIATGYRSEELTSYLLEKYPQVNFTFVHNGRYRETNNIYTMALVFESIEIDTDIILIESDLIYEPAVISRIIDSEYSNVALVDHFRSGMDGTVVTVTDNKITSIIPPHLQDNKFDFSDKYKTLNIYRFSKDFASTIFKQLLTYYSSVIDDNCYYELILGILIYMQKDVIHAEILQGEKWAEVDDPNDLSIAEYTFSDEKKTDCLDKTFGGYWNYDLIDFYFIRNMYFPNSSMLSELRSNLNNLIFNYGSKQKILNKKLAYFLLCNTENVVLLNGASQIYPLLQEIYSNYKVLIPNPTFGEYNRIFKNVIHYSDQVGIKQEELTEKTALADLIVIVNPNNPTGTITSTESIFRLANENKSKIFIVDESFIEFSGQKSLIYLLEESPLDNLIIIKSLSKSLGVPGIRLGYVYSTNKDFISKVMKYIPIWNSNSIAEFFLEIILKHRNSLQSSIVQTIKDRQELKEGFEGLPFVEKVYPSGANFLLVKFKINRPKLIELSEIALSKYNIYIKDVSDRFNNDENYYLRCAVRTPHENKILINCIDEIIQTLK